MKNRANHPTAAQFTIFTITSVLCACFFLPLQATATEKQFADIIIVVDLSGSMKARESTERFDEFFNWATVFCTNDDKIGVVAMGHGAKQVSPLTSKEDFSFSDISEKLHHRAKYTDVAAGLETAYYELKTYSRPGAHKIILMFSDAQIDMPKGMWDLENSLRYLHSSLLPAMKKENISIVSIVPQGLNANFQLLQELANGTNGFYYRGLPKDAVAIRTAHINRATPGITAQTQKTPAKIASAKQHDKATKPSTKTAVNDAAKTNNNRVTTQSSKSATDIDIDHPMQDQFLALIIVLSIGFALIVVAMFVLFKKTSIQKQETKTDVSEDLSSVLEEVQSLKQFTQQIDSEAKQYMDETSENEDLDFGEPKEQLSVSLVAPFLDYSEVDAEPNKGRTDEITSKPAFGLESSDDSSLSVSNMETLIGTVPEHLDEK